MSSPELGPVQRIADQHEVERFSCGKVEIDSWLQRHALQADRSDSARVFVVCRGPHVVGFYALCTHMVVPQQAPGRVLKGLSSRLPVPALLLARLGVDEREAGHGLGASLLADALRRCERVATEAGVRLMVVDALDDEARSFYERFGLHSFPQRPDRLYLMMKEIRRASQET